MKQRDLKSLLHDIVGGLDIHKQRIWVFIRDSSRLHFEGTIERSPEGLEKLQHIIQVYHVSVVVMESTNTYWECVYDALIELTETIVVNAHQLKVMGIHKTDERDCEFLTTCYYSGSIKYSYVPNPTIHDLRQCIRKRVKLLETQSGIVNQLKSRMEGGCPGITSVVKNLKAKYIQYFLQEWGTSSQSFDSFVDSISDGRIRKALERKYETFAYWWNNPPRKTILELIHQELRLFNFYETEIQTITDIIFDLATTDEILRARRLLTSIPGIGDITAITVIAEYGSAERFDTGDAAAASCGLTPRLKGSAGYTVGGHITKHGPSSVRRTLYLACKNVIRCSDRYRNVYDRIKERRCGKIAMIAVCRKLAKLCWHLWYHNTMYVE